ncbi:MAG: class I SAM-dependent methyltransferase [Candidatus Krumholzibacteriota bacterium]|nr:class I SAM-dependent methyltransferase [Candidatus Krumholzibacteriota bacterium]
MKILEFGCGSGGITLPLASLGCQVKAIDISSYALDLINNNMDGYSFDNLSVIQADACVFNDRIKYDVVVASEVFEHVDDPEALTRSIVARMNDRSILIVTIPNGYGIKEFKTRISPHTVLLKWHSNYYFRKWKWLRKVMNKEQCEQGIGSVHCQYFTMRGFLQIMETCNLHLIEYAKMDSLLTVLGPVYRKSAFLGNLDIKMADALPSWLASGWYFVFSLNYKMTDMDESR